MKEVEDDEPENHHARVRHRAGGQGRPAGGIDGRTTLPGGLIFKGKLDSDPYMSENANYKDGPGGPDEAGMVVEPLGVLVERLLPLNISRLPSRWPRTKPIRTRPVRAMTTFFPMEEGWQQREQGLADIKTEGYGDGGNRKRYQIG